MANDLQTQKAAELQRNEIFDTRSVVKKLEGLMDEVTKKEMSVDSVNAACNCAGRITEILRIHLDVERLKARRSS